MVHNCDKCNKRFTDDAGLKQHKESSHEEKQYKGDQCERKATTKTKVDTHTKTVHTDKMNNKSQYVSKRIKCEICQRKFNKKETFENHKKQYQQQNTLPVQLDNIMHQRKLRSKVINK